MSSNNIGTEDAGGEEDYQNYLKWNRVRNDVKTNKRYRENVIGANDFIFKDNYIYLEKKTREYEPH